MRVKCRDKFELSTGCGIRSSEVERERVSFGLNSVSCLLICALFSTHYIYSVPNNVQMHKELKLFKQKLTFSLSLSASELLIPYPVLNPNLSRHLAWASSRVSHLATGARSETLELALVLRVE